jgi:undecaprenyl-diphosphatase
MLSRSLKHFLELLGRWRAEPLIPALLLLIAGSLWGFIELTDFVEDREVHHFDQTLLLSMRTPGDTSDPIGPQWVEEMGRDLTALGGFTILTGLTIATFGVALFFRKPKLAALIAVSIFSGMLIMKFAKSSFDRPRPDLVPHGVVVSNASFPSGHTTMAAIVYLTLGVLLARTQTNRALRIYIISLSAIIAILVGVSRVYLGVHWPTDVLAGWTLGAAWALGVWLVAMKIDP